MSLKYYFRYNYFIRSNIANIIVNDYVMYLIMIGQQLCQGLIMLKGMSRVVNFLM